jgi:hypothetical protein
MLTADDELAADDDELEDVELELEVEDELLPQARSVRVRTAATMPYPGRAIGRA